MTSTEHPIATPLTPPANAWLIEYNLNRRPFWLISVLALLLFIFTFVLAVKLKILVLESSSIAGHPSVELRAISGWLAIQANRILIQKLIYWGACCFYLALWCVYFLGSRSAKNDSYFVGVQTLRRLLSITTSTFSDHESQFSQPRANQGQTSLDTGVQNKATSALTMLAMLIAVSTLELNFINNALKPSVGIQLSIWEERNLNFAAIGAVLALVAFVISADSLDCIFNGFKEPHTGRVLSHLFYRSTINWRYLGLTLILFVAAQVVASRNPLFGATALTVIIAAGYFHWFPVFSEDERHDLIYVPSVGRKRIALVAAILSPSLISFVCFCIGHV